MIKGLQKFYSKSRRYLVYKGSPGMKDEFATRAVEYQSNCTSGKLITLRQAVQLEETTFDLSTLS